MSIEFEPIGADMPPPGEQNGLKKKQWDFLQKLTADEEDFWTFAHIYSHGTIREGDPGAVTISRITDDDYQTLNKWSNLDRIAYWKNQPQQTYGEQMQRWKSDSADAVKKLSARYTRESEEQGSWYEQFITQWGDRVGIGELTSESFNENVSQQVYDRYFIGGDKASNSAVFIEDMIRAFQGIDVSDEHKETFEATKRSIREKMSGMFGENFGPNLESITYIEELIENDPGILENITPVVNEVLKEMSDKKEKEREQQQRRVQTPVNGEQDGGEIDVEANGESSTIRDRAVDLMTSAAQKATEKGRTIFSRDNDEVERPRGITAFSPSPLHEDREKGAEKIKKTRKRHPVPFMSRYESVTGILEKVVARVESGNNSRVTIDVEREFADEATREGAHIQRILREHGYNYEEFSEKPYMKKAYEGKSVYRLVFFKLQPPIEPTGFDQFLREAADD